MKVLFFLIITSNVLLFMWEYRHGALHSTSDVELVSKELILLASESKAVSGEDSIEKASSAEQSVVDDQQQLPEPITTEQSLPEQGEFNTQPTVSLSSTAVVCYEAGPFIDAKAYNVWHSLLKDTGVGIKPFDRDEPIISSYMVFYPVGNGIDQADAFIKMLKAYNIKDFLLQRISKDQTEVSLGVFNTESKALVLKNQLQAKGITVQVKPRYKSKTRKYVHVSGNAPALESLQNIANHTPEFSVKPVDICL
jgi:hypothetical protein